MGKNRSSIFQVSDITSYELFDYSKKFKNYINDVVFFTKNDPGHGDIFLNEKLYTYFHDIDYDNNIIYEDKFTCRLTRDRENHALQLTYISCSMDEVTFFVYNDTNIENPYTTSYDVKFTINNPVENLINDTNEGLITATHNIRDISLVNIDNNEYTIDCDRHSAIESTIIFTYVHNGQNYNYKLPIKCVEVDAPCQDVVLYPEVSYLYAGQTQEFSYYSIPQHSSDEYSFYNIPMSYNGRTRYGYDVAYVTCGDKVAYSYVYMIEPKIENILTYLYFTDKYLTANHVGKISATIYPPEIHTYALGDGSSYNITFFVNGNQIPDTCVHKDRNDVIYALFGFGNIGSETNQSYYYFEHAGQYEISSRITYQGQISENSVNYPVGIEPHLCSSISAYLKDDVNNTNYSNPININSRSDYDGGVSAINYLDFIVERHYNFANGETFDTNPYLKGTVQQNSDAHFEHENYGYCTKENDLTESQQYDGSYYREHIRITSANNIENDIIDKLTFYANDGSHASYSLNMRFISKYITPMLKDINAYMMTNSTIDISRPEQSVCTNPRKTYKLLSYYEPQNATVFKNLQYGESSNISHFITHAYNIENISNKNYISFISECNAYAADNTNIKFFIQNNLSYANINLPVQNSGGILKGIYYVNQLSYMGLNDNYINITYIPENSSNVYLEELSYSIIPDNPNYYRKIDLERVPDKIENGIHYFSYKINYNDAMWNDNGVILSIQPKVNQILNESTNEINTITNTASVFLTPRSAQISLDKQVIDKTQYVDQTETNVTLTISSGMNLINNNNLYYGYKKANNNYTYVKTTVNGRDTITENVTIDISSNGIYTFAVFHKNGSSYLKISEDATIDIITSTIQVNTIYEISFDKPNYIVNEEITLRLLVNADANDTSTLVLNQNSNNYNLNSPKFGEITNEGRYLTYKITSLSDNIYSLTQRFILKVNTNVNPSLYASTTIYPLVDTCVIKFTRNNVESNDVYENGSSIYKQLKISAICKKSLSGAIIPESELMSIEYQLSNTALGNIQNGIYYANDNEVGNQTIIPIVNGVQFSSGSFTQYTLPYELTGDVTKVWGYKGYKKNIAITSIFKTGIKYNNYKRYTLQYYYMSSQTNIQTLENEEINTINISVGNGDCAIFTPYNTNVSLVINIKEKEITNLTLSKILYVKGNKDYFGQYINVAGTNADSLSLRDLGEQYIAQSSISEDNTSIVFIPPAIYNNNTIAKYYFPTKVGNESFSLNTNITSDQFINNSSHKLTYSQIVIPIKVTEADYTANQTANTYVYISKNPVAGTQFYQKHIATPGIPNKIFTISFNNKYFNTPTLSGHFFVHEYAKFDSMTAYNQNCKYSIWGPQNYDNIGNTYINIAAIEQDWSILRNGEYFNAGSYTTYLSVLWYDDRIRNILPSTINIINGISNCTYYNGVYDYKEVHNDGTQESYIIPLTYYLIRNNQSIKDTLDQHLLSEYTICTGQGDNTITQSKLSIYSITIDASGNGTTASTLISNTEYTGKFRTLKITIRYMTSFPSVYNELTFTIIENGSFKSIPKNELESTFKWWFESSSLIQPHYTMSISKIEYELTTAASLYYDGLEVNNVFIKYGTDSQLIVASSTDLGIGIGISSHTLPYAINYFSNLGCLEWPYSSWDNFMLNNHHAFYTTANTPIIKLN